MVTREEKAVYKVLGLLKRPEGMAMDEFRRWWLEEHTPKVKKWPGLKAYTVNLTLDEVEKLLETWKLRGLGGG